MFCDLVGSTAFAEAVDAESSREALGRYHEMAQSAVEAHGGTVAKFIGDGVMATFGIPEVAEDDADRAVATGMELQRRFGPIQAHVQDRYGVALGLRVGVNTGELVISDDDADLVGDALNTAARLEAECVPGQVLVGEDTWRLTRSRFTYEVLGEVTVKGKAEPVATFQVVEVDVPREEDDTTPFVGRDEELEALEATFDSIVNERVAKLAMVLGSPGVGKTRLAQELSGRIGDGLRVFELRCERSGTSTFAPIADLLRSLAGIEAGHTPEEMEAALEGVVGSDVRDRHRLKELLGSFVGASAPKSTEEAFFAVRRLAEMFAQERPVLFVVDDIQWAEPLFLDLVEHLVEWVEDAPILILGLARPELRDVRPALTERGGRVSTVVPIEGLDPRATEQLAAMILGSDRLPDDLVDRLPDSTQGNPLFVREFIRMLVDDGTIARAGDGWEMAIDADAVEVPPTIQSLLASRVERMPPDERRVLELASVVGTEFPRGAVAMLAPDLTRSELEAVVGTLRRKEVLDPTGSYWGNEPIFRFHHVLIRDAAYRRLLKGNRADLHLRIAEWTEQTASDLVGEHETTIGFHYEQAFHYRRELGVDDDETRRIGSIAGGLFEAAARRALERDDTLGASGLAQRALATLDPTDARRHPLLLLACEAALASGDLVVAQATLNELDAAPGDARVDAWAACFHGQLIV
ncbi:MAG: ATP-binding protein, partial [Acidimicrobiales bacterium]